MHFALRMNLEGIEARVIRGGDCCLTCVALHLDQEHHRTLVGRNWTDCTRKLQFQLAEQVEIDVRKFHKQHRERMKGINLLRNNRVSFSNYALWGT